MVTVTGWSWIETATRFSTVSSSPSSLLVLIFTQRKINQPASVERDERAKSTKRCGDKSVLPLQHWPTHRGMMQFA